MSKQKTGAAMLISRSQNPILAGDKDWERGGILSATGAFTEDEGDAIRLYYRISFPEAPLRNVLCLARSSDLETWEKPDLGDGTNIVMRGSGNEVGYGTFMTCRILRNDLDRTATNPWTMLYWDRLTAHREPGFCLATSSDGIHWTPISRHPFITSANDAASLIEARKECITPLGKASHYVYQQTWKYNPALPKDRDNLKGLHRRISIWRAGSLSGPWRGPISILEPDESDPLDTQFYWLSPFPLGNGYGGLLHCHHTVDQTMDVQLIVSEDGWSWQRALNRSPLLGLGERGRFDCGMVSAWAMPIRWKNRVLLFYSGRATVHDGQARYSQGSTPEPGIGIAEFSDELLNMEVCGDSV